MDKTAICILLMAMASEAFFLQSKDIRSFLRFLPRSLEASDKQDRNPKPSASIRNRPHENLHNQDKSTNQYYDRYSKDPTKVSRHMYDQHHRHNDKQIDYYPHHPHSHVNCDEKHDHYHHKYPEHRHENPHKNKFEDVEEIGDYYYEQKPSYPLNDKRSHQYDNKQSEKSSEDVDYEKSVREKNPSFKKDYITGILVSIPKIKNDDNSDDYYRESRQHNQFFQNILKSAENGEHQPQGVIKSYVY